MKQGYVILVLTKNKQKLCNRQINSNAAPDKAFECVFYAWI